MSSTQNQNLSDALLEYEKFSDSVVNNFLLTVNKEDVPNEIFHYTNDVGLYGILESQKLRLTDIFGVNDPSEIKHGFSYALDILQKNKMLGTDLQKVFVSKLGLFALEGLHISAHFFIFSFSKYGDDLNQWRAYADNGKGYALVFDASELEQEFANPNGVPSDHAMTFAVKYDDEVVRGLHRELVSPVFDLIGNIEGRSVDEAERNKYLSQLSKGLSARIIHTATFFKHASYKDEAEYRFMEIFRGDRPAPDIKSRVRSSQIVKYREYDWGKKTKHTLKKIIIGPSANVSESTKFVEHCLRNFGLDSVTIEVSKIPYRVF